ncbi:transcriptional regulator [Clostridium sp. ZBS20]|uniref:transcriptional regulator n=1 Tax=Clostridium sp. ZBS20 TaxID=2949966 RepID=UPI002079B58E|nr:transcriptional regulator [Clostridium sp. ZBS20]
MEKELFQKTEGQLYRYYRYKKQISKKYRKVESLEEQIKAIDNQIRNVHNYISLDTMPPGAGCGERVQASISGSSYMEKQMENEVTKLEQRKVEKIKQKIKTESKIMEMKSFIRMIDTNIESLREEDKRFIELKYGDKKEVPYIVMQLNMAQATAYRHREELVENIADSMWMYK